jgi:diguanylate cyclase (GGDEF)-like protein
VGHPGGVRRWRVQAQHVGVERRVMFGARARTAVAALVVAVALIAALGLHLLDTQSQGRRTLREALERRATLTASLIGSAFSASASANDAQARFGGPRPAVSRAVRQYAAADPRMRVMVLDASGAILAAAPARPSRRVSLAGRRDLLAASRGHRALSDLLRDEGGRGLIEIAVPFQTRYGRRVLVTGAPVEIVRTFAAGFFASASAIARSEGYLLDGVGRPLAATKSAPDPGLTAALARHASGVYGQRTFVSATVPSSRWRVVLTVPSGSLYAAVDGAPRRAAWELFAAFTAAILALLALGIGAARGAQRLAAATERADAARRLAHERLHDALTGLPNRTLFADRAEHALAAARRSQGRVAVLFMDIDHFKGINDSLGHDAGDAVLREVAERITDTVRSVDTVSRFGGDEFVVLCEDLDDGQARRLAARIQDSLQPGVTVGERPVPVTVSIGVAAGGADPDVTAGDLVRDADTAMYRAKDRGRGGIELFDAELHRQAVERFDAEVALRQAIADEEFVVHYQPIVTLPDGALHGVEALVRWQRPHTGELVPPGDFIPLAEETGLIVELGEWVLHAAMNEVGDWGRRGLVDDEFELSVNVSARQLADPRLCDTVAGALQAWDRPADRLCLEITESAVMADPTTALRTLEGLHALGVRLAIDDFGVGHSSLGQLARVLPISILKLDRSFVAAMDASRDRSIVEAAASLARALGLASVAEGVESADQATQLAAMGFPYAQGFHFGRPVAAEHILNQLHATSRT